MGFHEEPLPGRIESVAIDHILVGIVCTYLIATLSGILILEHIHLAGGEIELDVDYRDEFVEIVIRNESAHSVTAFPARVERDSGVSVNRIIPAYRYPVRAKSAEFRLEIGRIRITEIPVERRGFRGCCKR